MQGVLLPGVGPPGTRMFPRRQLFLPSLDPQTHMISHRITATTFALISLGMVGACGDHGRIVQPNATSPSAPSLDVGTDSAAWYLEVTGAPQPSAVAAAMIPESMMNASRSASISVASATLNATVFFGATVLNFEDLPASGLLAPFNPYHGVNFSPSIYYYNDTPYGHPSSGTHFLFNGSAAANENVSFPTPTSFNGANVGSPHDYALQSHAPNTKYFWFEGYRGGVKVAESQHVHIIAQQPMQWIDANFNTLVDRVYFRTSYGWWVLDDLTFNGTSDNTPPVIVPTVTGTLNSTTGWYTSDVTLTWAVTDPQSPVSSSSGCSNLTLTSNQADQTYTCTATSAGGTSTQSVTIKIDKTIPVVTGAVTSGTQGANGWYVTDVGITWTPSVPGPSGQTLSPDCATVSLTADKATYTFTCSVKTGAGLSSAQGTVTVKRDVQTPSINYTLTGTLSGTGWYTTDVGVVWTTTSGPSGVTSCSSPSATVDALNITFNCSATAGNGKTASRTTLPVRRDATPPTVTYSAHPAVYTVDQAVSIVCQPADNLSGVASSTCQNIIGDGYTFALGPNTFSASATDNAGNVSSTASTSFTMTVTSASLCALVERWTSNAGVANSLCVKLQHGDYDPFRNELAAQTGKKISDAHAAILLRLVNAL